jgi:replicative DNA helicase
VDNLYRLSVLAVETELPTPAGWVTVGDLKRGDLLFDEQGQPCRVTALRRSVPSAAVRLTLDSSITILTSPGHPMKTLDTAARQEARARGLTTASPDWAQRPSMRVDQVDRTRIKKKRLVHAVPLGGPLSCVEANLPIDPWVLGAWLGDGCKDAPRLTIGDQDVSWTLDELTRRGVYVSTLRRDRTAWSIAMTTRNAPVPEGTLSVVSDLRRLGVLHNKHIPQVYMRASAEQRLDLLRGLMDTDGSASKQAPNQVEFVNTRASIAEGAAELAISLGLKATININRSTLNGIDYGPRYRVTWSGTICPFLIPRKAAKWQPGYSEAPSLRRTVRMVSGIEPCDENVEMRAFATDSPNKMVLATRKMIPVGTGLTS